MTTNPAVLTTDKLYAPADGGPRRCLVCEKPVGACWHGSDVCYGLNGRLKPYRPTRATASDYRRRMVDDEVTLDRRGWSVRFGTDNPRWHEKHPHLAGFLAGFLFAALVFGRFLL